MLISFCIPCMNRAHDLKRVMPHLLRAANDSPPVEVVVVNYNSRDDLADYLVEVRDSTRFTNGSRLTFVRYSGRNTFYHMAHARNLSALSAEGDVVVIFSSDLIPRPGFVEAVRGAMEADPDLVWMHGAVKYVGVIACKRSEFIDAGGYDERFEFYGPEDKDLQARLRRRGSKYSEYSESLLDIIPTPTKEKMRNYRLRLTKLGAKRMMRPIFDENNRAGVLVANEGIVWGSWQ